MPSKTLKADDPDAKRYEDLRIANAGPLNAPQPKPKAKPAAKEPEPEGVNDGD